MRVVGVVGGYNGDVELAVKVHQALIYLREVWDIAVAHQFQEIAAV